MKQWISFSLLIILGNFVCYAQNASDLRQDLNELKQEYKDEMKRAWDAVQNLQQNQLQTHKKVKKDFDATVEKYIKDSGKVPLTWQDIISSKNKIKFYGFLRLDVAFDTDRTDNGNFAQFVLNHNSSAFGNDEELNIHARLTRFGFELAGTPLSTMGNPELSGRLEIDFFGGGPESRNFIRMRHAYLKLNWREWDISLLAGQTNDIVAPLTPHTIDLGTPFWQRGNIGDRRPQLRLEWSPAIVKGTKDEETRLFFTAGLLRAGAVNGIDIDGDGNNDGQDSGAPMIQTRMGIATPSWVNGQKIRFGFSTSHSWYDTQTGIGARGETDFNSHVYALDLTLPITERIELAAEWWRGTNASDLQGGIGQGIDVFRGKEIESTGGWISMKVKTTERSSMAVGYSFDNPEDNDVRGIAGGRFFNQTYFINNVWDFSGGVSMGLEYQYMTTYYSRTDDSNYNNRLLAFIMYNF